MKGAAAPVVPDAFPPNHEESRHDGPHAGRDGRVGYAFSDAGYLPEDSMEYAFEGLEGWLLAILKSRACRRIVLT